MKRILIMMATVPAVCMTAFAAIDFERSGDGIKKKWVSPPEGTFIKQVSDDLSVTSLAFTVEFWFRPSGTPSEIKEQDVICQYAGGDAGRMLIGLQSGQVFFHIGGKALKGDTVLSSGTWYHIACTRDSSGYCRIYLDGEKDTETSLFRGSPLPAADMEFGSLSASGSNTSLNGAVSELRVWNVALAQEEVAGARFCRLPSSAYHPKTLLYCWPFDDGSGTECREIVSGNNATVAADVASHVSWSATEPSFADPSPVHPWEKSLDVGRLPATDGIVSDKLLAVPQGTYIKQVSDDLTVTSLAFTVEFWLKPHGDPANDNKVIWGELDAFTQFKSGDAARMFVGINKRKLYFFLGSSRLFGDTDLTGDKWQHAAFVRDAEGNMSIYLDGVKNSSDEVRNVHPLPVADIGIGRLHQSTAAETSLNGLLSELRVWNTARSAEEIAACYKERATGTEEGLLYCWPFDEGGGALCREKVSGEFAMIRGMEYVSWAADRPGAFRRGLRVILR